ncbi:hypothetical protein [Vibrio barjaei]|uniref:hypothetical protein n=1 Tax=Vibrio barjaei TaxID=1676683 RepID=UPI002284490C|nr:hypothetical protein [Vibrio barjaei]MCY9874011.1 hypothetical protein [Vibrio barjaei]
MQKNIDIHRQNCEYIVNESKTNTKTAFTLTLVNSNIAVIMDTTAQRPYSPVSQAAQLVVPALKKQLGQVPETIICQGRSGDWKQLKHNGESLTESITICQSNNTHIPARQALQLVENTRDTQHA